MSEVFSNLDLDGATPVRAQPSVGEWGPVEVTSTAQKKRQRVYAVLAFAAALAVIVGVGAFWYQLIWG